jgi:hypothetical protein
MRVVERCGEYDVYHLPEYHLLSEPQERGRGVLFAYREGDALAAWPFVIREISAIDGLESAGAGYSDMTSVYGYPGPVWNTQAGMRDGFFARFQKVVENAAREMRIVSMFSRMNPVLGNAGWIGDIGVLEKMGQTVSIDLTEPVEVQLRGYRKDHRDGIRKAGQRGCAAFHDASMAHFEEFIDLYHQTMTRVGAGARYFFDQKYFADLRTAMGAHLHLFVASLADAPCAAGLFIHTGSIVQFHLSGSSPEGLKHAGSKLVVDEARKWAVAAGAHSLHLGGGVGSKEDSLFLFKSGFSGKRHDFLVWKNILQPELYRDLLRTRKEWLLGEGGELADDHFFPAYRATPVRTAV